MRLTYRGLLVIIAIMILGIACSEQGLTEDPAASPGAQAQGGPKIDWGGVDSGDHEPCNPLVETPNGRVLIPNSQRGVFLTDNPESPWYQATFFSHGTSIKNVATDKVIWDTSVIEAVQPDGDVSWISLAERYEDGASNFKFIGGTGKWYGITGHGRVLHGKYEPEIHTPASEDEEIPVWEMTWEVKPVDLEARQTIELLGPEDNPNVDWGDVENGDHEPCGPLVETPNGHTLIPNAQVGVFLSTNPDSPWHNATFNSHGTNIKDTATGKVLWDVSTIEAVQPDGDVTWIALAEKYEEGLPVFEFIGGTGKWYGITGHGRVLHSDFAPLIYDPDAHPDAEEGYLPVWEITWEVPQ